MVELEHIGDGDHQIEELGLKAAPLIGEGFELLGQLQQLELGEPVPLLKGAAPGAGRRWLKRGSSPPSSWVRS